MAEVIVIVRGGAVVGACSNDPNLDVEVLDYDDWNDVGASDVYQKLSDRADALHAVY